jgi:CoA:oxalate CoA-transferase
MLDSTFALLENAIARYCLTNIVPKPLGNRHSSAAPFQAFETRDGKVLVCSVSDENWQSFSNGIARLDLARDPRFKTMLLRQQNIDELVEAIQKELRNWTSVDLMCAMDRVGIVNGQVNTLDQVVEHPQILARKMIMDISYPGAEPMQTAASPIKMRSFEEETEGYCAGLGENTIEIMMKYGQLEETQAQALYHEVFEEASRVTSERSIT